MIKQSYIYLRVYFIYVYRKCINVPNMTSNSFFNYLSQRLVFYFFIIYLYPSLGVTTYYILFCQIHSIPRDLELLHIIGKSYCFIYYFFGVYIYIYIYILDVLDVLIHILPLELYGQLRDCNDIGGTRTYFIGSQYYWNFLRGCIFRVYIFIQVPFF